MLRFPIYAAGEWIETTETLVVTSKFSSAPYAQTFLANQELLSTCIQAAQQAKAPLAAMPSYQRYNQLRYIANAIDSARLYLAELLSNESAKPIKYALAEVDRASQTFLIAAEESKRLPKEYISLDWTPAGTGKQGLIAYKPIGIVAGISPFNFPLNLAVHKIAPALAAACPIILKPASATPLSMLALAKIIDQTSFPKGSVSVLPMSRALGEQLAQDPAISFLSFTGSPNVGWHLKSLSGKKKVILELGGNAAAIITETADLDAIIPACVTGAFAYSGQICIHTQRFIVHPNLLTAFIEKMKVATVQLKFGEPTDPATDISVMIDEANAIRVETWINEALEAGASLVCGGTRTHTMVVPTILTQVPATAKVYEEEAFGPVICIEAYTGDIHDAIKKVNNSKYGLQASVFTNSISELNACFEYLEVGGVIHNAITTTRFDHMPYGGVKDSGIGREGVKYAIHDLLEPRILVTSQ